MLDASITSLRFISPEAMRTRIEDTTGAVAQRAFAIFERNGRRHGHDVEDWLQAEAEILEPAPVEIDETDRALTLRAQIPGFRRKDLQLSVEPRRVTISAAREVAEAGTEHHVPNGASHARRALRIVDLPAAVDARHKAVTAAFSGGTLTITLPKER